jgi:hypothetical protein
MTGRLRYITRLDPFGTEPLPQLQRRLAKVEANMNTNAAYQFATNCLAAASVDLEALERQHRATVRQHFFHGKGEEKFLLPIYDVLWGRTDRPAVIVTIYAPTAELLQLRQEDESFSRRPARSLKNVEALLAIRDPDFLKYTPLERNALLSGEGQMEGRGRSDSPWLPRGAAAAKAAEPGLSP